MHELLESKYESVRAATLMNPSVNIKIAMGDRVQHQEGMTRVSK
jgi:hypothetical protein